MDEYIDILTKEGIPIGKSELKSVVHQKGYYHNTAHIWFYTTQGEILLSQRSAKKKICPLLWDVSVAGHIDAGESIKQAAIRESSEEIGISIAESDLKEIGVFQCFQTYDTGIIDNEFHNTFICELHVDISKLVLQKEEVEAVKLVSFKRFNQLIETIKNNDNHFVPSNKSYYEFVLQQIVQTVNSTLL